ncbi:MAG: FAD-binding oxidoreductase [Thermoleophilia bacterium]|nr:FAD-binding oxidoreductase [Thermoleophilia bacterium]
MKDVLVVGGGIVGLSVAVACARRELAVCLVESGSTAGGASGLELALLPAGVDARAYLDLHHFSGGSFLLDRSLPEGWPARRLDARAAAAALVEEARGYRVELRTHCEASSLIVRRGAVGGVLADAGELRAGTTVVAAGAASWRICRALGRHVPVRAEPVDLLVTEPAPFELERPVVAGEAWVAQDAAGRLVAADPERAAQACPELAGLPVLERRTLPVPLAAGGAPLEGPLEGVRGLVLACGHGHEGIARAPATAARIAAGVASGAWATA